jgi:hypothetical protein
MGEGEEEVSVSAHQPVNPGAGSTAQAGFSYIQAGLGVQVLGLGSISLVWAEIFWVPTKNKLSVNKKTPSKITRCSTNFWLKVPNKGIKIAISVTGRTGNEKWEVL